MRPQDAQDILRMIENLWQFDFGAEGRATWRPIIENMEDAAIVTKAILNLARKEDYRPSIASIKGEVTRLEKNAAPAFMTQVSSGGAMPPWVLRWFYARFRKEPPDTRAFHEQFPDIKDGPPPHPHQSQWMPEGLYEEEAKSIDPRIVTSMMRGAGVIDTPAS